MPPPASIVIPTRTAPAIWRWHWPRSRRRPPPPAPNWWWSTTADQVQVRALAERFAARYLAPPRPRGLNAARNTGIAAHLGRAAGVRRRRRGGAPRLARGAARGARPPTRRRGLRGADSRAASRTSAAHSAAARSLRSPALDLGRRRPRRRFRLGGNLDGAPLGDRARVGPFDAGAPTCTATRRTGSARLKTAGGRVRYVAAAALDHRRAGADARLPPAWPAPPTAGAAQLTALRRAQGHRSRRWPLSCARWRAAPGTRPAPALWQRGIRWARTPPGGSWRPCAPPGPAHPTSSPGHSGTVGGRRALLLGAARRDAGRGRAAERPARPGGSRGAASAHPPRRVLVAGVDRPGGPGLLASGGGRAAPLPPPRAAGHRARAGASRQVREPQRPACRTTAPTGSTGWW